MQQCRARLEAGGGFLDGNPKRTHTFTCSPPHPSQRFSPHPSLFLLQQNKQTPTSPPPLCAPLRTPRRAKHTKHAPHCFSKRARAIRCCKILPRANRLGTANLGMGWDETVLAASAVFQLTVAVTVRDPAREKNQKHCPRFFLVLSLILFFHLWPEKKKQATT